MHDERCDMTRDTTDYLLAADHAWRDADLAYLPRPNLVDVVLTDVEAPPAVTRTAFAIPVTEDGRVVMVENRRRGLEMAGGHVEAGETSEQAAAREALEETGCEVADLVPIGVIRMVSRGKAPEGWSYPHPVGFQQIYAGRVVSRREYVENDECLAPRDLTIDEAAATLKGHERVLVTRALDLVAFGSKSAYP